MGSTVIVIPTYNEARNVERLLDEIEHLHPTVDVLIVDDSSPDGTANVARAWSDSHALDVHVLMRPNKGGLGTAYRAGFARALSEGFDVIVQMDGDGSHPIRALPSMLQALAAGADLAIGSRYVAGGGCDARWPWHRRLLSRAGNGYCSRMLKVQAHDLTGGFKAWRSSCLRDIDMSAVTSSGYGFQIEMTVIAVTGGSNLSEVPIQFGQRWHGQSKMTARIVAEALLVVLTLRRRLKRQGRQGRQGSVVDVATHAAVPRAADSAVA